jgi:hypothetical protein
MPFAPTIGGQWHADSASSHKIKSSLDNLECNISISNSISVYESKEGI